jgi:hypothetical protein
MRIIDNSRPKPVEQPAISQTGFSLGSALATSYAWIFRTGAQREATQGFAVLNF